MKKLFQFSLIAMVAAGLTLSGCKKKDDDQDTEDGTEQTEMSSDEAVQNNEIENALNDANTAVNTTGFGKGSPIAGATIDDTTFIAQKKIVITYNGTSADGLRNRTGQVTVQLINGTHWRDAGAELKIEAINLRITHVSSGKSITINGTHYLTNVSGGIVFTNPAVVHRARGTSVVSFDNGTSRNWEIARKRTFTNNSGVLSLSIEGDSTVDGHTNVIVWGTNRRGVAFYTQVTQPVVFSTSCTAGPLSGVKVHTMANREVTVTFGVDQSGNPFSGSGCPYGLKVGWTSLLGKSKTAVISY